MHGSEIQVMKIFKTYGPCTLSDNDRVVSNFIVQALMHEPLTLHGDGSQTRSFCNVYDLIWGMIRLLYGCQCGPINIVNQGEFTILKLATLVRCKIIQVPPLIERPLPANVPLHRQSVIGLVWRRCVRSHGAAGASAELTTSYILPICFLF